MYNWNTMNQKVFKRLGFSVPRQDLEAVANCQVSFEACLIALCLDANTSGLSKLPLRGSSDSRLCSILYPG